MNIDTKNLFNNLDVAIKNNKPNRYPKMENAVSFSMIIDNSDNSDNSDNNKKNISDECDISDMSDISCILADSFNDLDDSSLNNFSCSDINNSYNGSSAIPITINNNHNPNNSSDEDSNITLLSETPPDPFVSIEKRSRLRWVDDTHASKCENCKNTFRMFLRRHHCIKEGTPITMLNGMARKIEDIIPTTHIPSWDETNNNINVIDGIVNSLMNQGMEPCRTITLQDGRKLEATSDHKILVTGQENKPYYVMVKDLNSSHRVV